MKYLKQFGVVTAVSFAAELIRHAIPAPIPASVYGLALMFFALKFRWIKIESIDETGKFLLDIMPLMFIPPAVGLVDAWRNLNGVWTPALLLIFVGTGIVMAATGGAAQLTIRFQERRDRRARTK